MVEKLFKGHLILNWKNSQFRAVKKLPRKLKETEIVIEVNIKNGFERWYASVYEEVKDTLIAKYGKTATTEATVKNAILNKYPDTMADWQKKMVSAKYKKGRLSGAKDSFGKKNDNLINLLAYYRRLAENGG